MKRRVIWKKQLEVVDDQIIEVPKGAMFLAVQIQHQVLCIWYECDPDEPLEKRKLGIVGTGIELRNTLQTYIGTFQYYGGSLIFHVYEERFC